MKIKVPFTNRTPILATFLAGAFVTAASIPAFAIPLPPSGAHSWITAHGPSGADGGAIGSLAYEDITGTPGTLPYGAGSGSATAGGLTAFATSSNSHIDVNAAKFDTFTLHGAGVGPVSFTVVLTVTGSVSVLHPTFSAVSRATVSAAIGTYRHAFGDVSAAGPFDVIETQSFAVGAPGGSLPTAEIVSSFAFSLTSTRTMALDTPFDLGFQLHSGVFNNATLDATATISFILPEGVTITSYDGFVDPSSSVPDGGMTLALLGLPLMGLVAFRRRNSA